MRCPKCRLENPPSALRCDCGYDFLTSQMKESFLSEPKKESMLSSFIARLNFFVKEKKDQNYPTGTEVYIRGGKRDKIKCPKCGLINYNNASECSCGFRFSDQLISEDPAKVIPEKAIISSKELPIRWLFFYTYIVLPLKIITSPVNILADYDRMVEAGYKASINPSAFIPIAFIDIFICFVIYGLHKKRLWGWICNWLFLGLMIFSGYNPRISLGANIVAVILIFLIFFLPNYFYFKKRKYLFKNLEE